MNRVITIVVLLIFISITGSAQPKLTRQEYIDAYKGIAINEMRRSGIPASITLAQGILESDNGNSTLAVKANNHFGIKCHNGWTGKTFTHDDDKPNECFRKYRNADESFRDHSDFLTTHQRYKPLFDLHTTDYKSWARGLKKAGYATNNQYDKLLIRIIEEHELYRFDDKKYKPKEGEQNVRPKKELADNVDDYAINPFGNDVKTYNRINYVVVKEGDTFESIAEKHELRSWQLYKYNELPHDATLQVGDRIYLQPKRRKAEVGNKYHTIKPGENMYIISQQYGIKMKHLYRINNLEYNREPEIGYTISLRKRKK
jgi:LysM repeat protein